MGRVDEIEAAIRELPPDEFRRLADWIRERDHALWDAKLDRDSAAGKLDFLFDEADLETKEGAVRDWPANK
jgi:hypothetical protein